MPCQDGVVATQIEPGSQPWALAASDGRPVIALVFIALWSASGVAVALVMARRGHARGPWCVLGAVFGPLVGGLAAESRLRADAEAGPVVVARGAAGSGDLVVVVAVLGDPSNAADAGPVLRWMGRHVGSTLLVRPVDVDAVLAEDPSEREAAGQVLSQAALFLPGPAPELVLVPGTTAAGVTRFATDVGAAAVVVVGDTNGRAVAGCARRLRGRSMVVGTPSSTRRSD